MSCQVCVSRSGQNQVMAGHGAVPPLPCQSRRPPDGSDTAKGQLKAMRSAGDHLVMLIDDVLDMSRLEAGRADLHPTLFDPRMLLKELEATFRLKTQQKREAERNARVRPRVDRSGRVPHVTPDRPRASGLSCP